MLRATGSSPPTSTPKVSLFPSFEDRDGIVASGMEDGARESLDRLDELLVRS